MRKEKIEKIEKTALLLAYRSKSRMDLLKYRMALLGKGPYIKYDRNFLAFFDPLPTVVSDKRFGDI